MSEKNPRTADRGSARPTRRSRPAREGAAGATKKRPAAAKRKPAGTAVRPRAARGAADRRAAASQGASALGAIKEMPGRVAGAAKSGPAVLRELVASHRAVALVCVALVVAVVALYGPSCELYRAWRKNGELQAQQAAATTEGDELEGDISTLLTEEGIKDEARRRGYVEEGETRIVVEGADSGSGQDGDQAADATPWYLDVTDFIFGYSASDEGEQ